MSVAVEKKRRTPVPGKPAALDILRVDGWAEMLESLPGTGDAPENSLRRYLTDQDFRDAERERLPAEMPGWPSSQLGGVEYEDLSRSLKEHLDDAAGWLLVLARDEETLAALDDTEYRAALKMRQPDAAWPVPGLTDEAWHGQAVSGQG